MTHVQHPASDSEALDPSLKSALIEKITAIPGYSAFNVSIQELALGTCTVTAPRDPKCDGIFECFHGGVLMAIADMAACFAIMTHTGPEQILSTTDMNIRFLAPCMTEVRAVANVIKAGKLICPATVDLYDANGKHVAVAQVTYIRLNKMPAR